MKKALLATAVAAIAAVALFAQIRESIAPRPAATSTAAGSGVEEAFRERVSNVQVEGTGRVARVLSDDNKGSRHQRFILRLGSGRTVLVSHNIDLAPRLPSLRVGDHVSFRGEYEWNKQGGVIHWTHDDPDGRHDGGWLKHGGRTYH